MFSSLTPLPICLLQECQQDLASVLPALKKAIESLETLDKASISEIRVYTSPPYLVLTVLNAVCVLFQKKPDWPTAKQMLGDPNFLKKLLQFDKNSLPDKVRSGSRPGLMLLSYSIITFWGWGGEGKQMYNTCYKRLCLNEGTYVKHFLKISYEFILFGVKGQDIIQVIRINFLPKEVNS